jgi:polyribonucleotide nucleotidyltransferase
MQAMRSAVQVAKETMDQRLESMNEFRAALTEQAATFLPRNEYIVQHNAIGDKIETLKTTIEEKVEAAKITADKRHTELENRIKDAELFKANINGRILATGGVVIIAFGLIDALLHYLWK